MEVGPRAVLDGVSALVAAGLEGIEEETIHVAVPKSATPRRCKGVRVHETRRYSPDDIVGAGLPRTRPATAAVHAALWAKSDEQAALFLIAPVQQGLTTVAKLAEALARIRHAPRLALLRAVLRDIGDGVHSIGELEFTRMCSARKLPAPTRQSVRETPSGRRYVDADFDPYGVSVEIDGAQHRDAAAAVADALKQNESCIGGRIQLRIPVWALRTNADPFMHQLEAALRSRGWKRAEDQEDQDQEWRAASG